MNKEETSNIPVSEDLITYVNGLADKIQNKMEENSTNMNKKLDEMNTQLNTLEKTLKQMQDNN
ncbi:unnamed protein product [Rhizopus stolonifer]